MKTKISNESLATITEAINDVLLKRGFPAITATVTGDEKSQKIEIVSEEFNTTPVIMKSIQVKNFGGSITDDRIEVSHNGEMVTVDMLRVYLPIHAFFEYFSGGTNSTELFTIKAEILTPENDRQYVEITRAS